MVIELNSLYELPKEMDRLLAMFDKAGMLHGESAYPRVNVYENENEYIVDASIPGVPPADLELTLAARSLVIRGERKSPAGRYYRQERIAGVFQRVITLNVPVDKDKVTAKSQNGIVRITLPKSEDVKPRRISIES